LQASNEWSVSDDSIVIRENTSGGFYMLGENPHMGELWDSYSAVRVYCLTDNIINPRYFYFMVKPIGVDQFIIPYVPQITEGTALKSGVIFSNNFT
jgi:hypothetical protein